MPATIRVDEPEALVCRKTSGPLDLGPNALLRLPVPLLEVALTPSRSTNTATPVIA
jgi:hypothetical protein